MTVKSKTWSDTFLRTLKENDVKLVSYVPDNVLTPLIGGAAAKLTLQSQVRRIPRRPSDRGEPRGVLRSWWSRFSTVSTCSASRLVRR